MKAGKKVAFHTLGCKLNFSETSTIARLFEEQGYQKVDFKSPADVYIINTCSVTDNADKECKQIVKSALKVSPDAKVAIIGCYAQLKPNEIAQFEGVDLVLGAKEKFNILQYINALDGKQAAQVHSCEVQEANTFIGSYSIGDRTRAFLKVQDGCDYNCSFCTIPLARGNSRSDTVSHVLETAKSIGVQGIQEIVLTGVNLGDFGKGAQGGKAKQETFYDLALALDEQMAVARYRISSIEPNLLTNPIIELVSRSNTFMPHFHVPLQSGSNAVLKRMRRRYMRELYAERVSTIKTAMPHACIGVDVIVGFPGETDEEFNDTYAFLNELDISYLHVFTYSERDNTDAISYSGAVPMELRKKRNKMLRILSEKKLRAFYQQHLNTHRVALLEGDNKEGYMHGFTDNYIKIQLPYQEELVNTLISVRLVNINAQGVMEAQVAESVSVNP